MHESMNSINTTRRTMRSNNYAAPEVECPFDLYLTIQGCFLTSLSGMRLSGSYWRSYRDKRVSIAAYYKVR